VRLIFCLPLILGTVSSLSFHSWIPFYWPPFHGRGAISGGLGGALFIIYLILWIILPKARSATDKLEMRGEEINLETIKNTVKEDPSHARNHPSVASRLGHGIGVLFKAFFLFIAGVIALGLITALMAILFGGIVGVYGPGIYKALDALSERAFGDITCD